MAQHGQEHRMRHSRFTLRTKSGEFSMEKLGISRFDFKDPYHLALTLSWPGFFALLVLAYLALNLIFAALYYAVPGNVTNLPPGSALDAFFFSVETLSTVGYGFMVPATLYGHVVVTIEVFVGMLFTATMTGLVFVRFSRPKAKIIFADAPVVARHLGRPALLVRIGNGRLNPLADAHARFSVLMAGPEPGGDQQRRAFDLKLIRSEFPFFPLTWTLVHELDESSPLHPLSRESAEASRMRLMLSIAARDPSLGAQVYASQVYRGTEISFGTRYVDAVSWDGEDTSIVDMRKISLVEPDID